MNHPPCHPRASRRRLRPPRVGAWIRRAPAGLAALAIACAGAAGAELPRFSAALGAGVGGLRSQQYVEDVSQAVESGRFSRALWWSDLTWQTRRGWTIGVGAHLLRVPIEDPSRVGTCDLMPVLVQAGVRRSLVADRVWGFAAVGAGVTWTRFVRSDATGEWEAAGGGDVRFSNEWPFTLGLVAGLDYALTPELLLEAGAGAVYADSRITYRLARESGSGGGFVERGSVTVEARHLLLRLGVRWWFEWW